MFATSTGGATLKHSPETRQEVLARVAGGESRADVARSLAIHPSQVARWCQAAAAARPQIATLARDRIAHDLQLAMLKCVDRTLELLPHAKSAREAASVMKIMSDMALDWTDGRRGGARDVAGSPAVQFTILGEIPIDERRAALARLIDGADEPHA